MDIDKVKADSVGRWPGILQGLGIKVGNGRHCPCPKCGGDDRFRFDDKEGRGTWYCNNCGAGDGFELVQQVLGVNFVEACKSVSSIVGTVELGQQQKQTASSDVLRKIFKNSKPTRQGDIVHQYLMKRGLREIPQNIRTGRCWESETKRDQWAMLSVFHDADGDAVTMHRTYLDNTGKKLDIKSPKKVLTPLKPMTGGAVRLFEADDMLAITEGIETAIAVHEAFGFPVWAALSATLMESFVPPARIKAVLIYGDNDKNFTGQKSAYVLANRLAMEGLTVGVEFPLLYGTDFLDEIIERREAVKSEVKK